MSVLERSVMVAAICCRLDAMVVGSGRLVDGLARAEVQYGAT